MPLVHHKNNPHRRVYLEHLIDFRDHFPAHSYVCPGGHQQRVFPCVFFLIKGYYFIIDPLLFLLETKVPIPEEFGVINSLVKMQLLEQNITTVQYSFYILIFMEKISVTIVSNSRSITVNNAILQLQNTTTINLAMVMTHSIQLKSI